MSVHRLDEYLRHILQAVERVEVYTCDLSREDFMVNGLVQDAVLRNIEVVGEASHKIELLFPEFAAAHPELPLRSAYQMRNSVSHGYLDVDLLIVWNTAKVDLPDFGSTAKELLEQ